MSGVEALARVLWLAGDGETVDFGGYSVRDSETVAAAILADPGPLLAALAEAGVLERISRQAEFGKVRDVYAAKWMPAEWTRHE